MKINYVKLQLDIQMVGSTVSGSMWHRMLLHHKRFLMQSMYSILSNNITQYVSSCTHIQTNKMAAWIPFFAIPCNDYEFNSTISVYNCWVKFINCSPTHCISSYWREKGDLKCLWLRSCSIKCDVHLRVLFVIMIKAYYFSQQSLNTFLNEPTNV